MRCCKSDFITNCELVWKQSVWTSTIATSLAAKHLTTTGLLVLTGAMPALGATPGQQNTLIYLQGTPIYLQDTSIYLQDTSIYLQNNFYLCNQASISFSSICYNPLSLACPLTPPLYTILFPNSASLCPVLAPTVNRYDWLRYGKGLCASTSVFPCRR